MAVKKPICIYSGKLKELQSGDTMPGSGSSFTIVTTDPVSPANGDAWVFQNSIAPGQVMGMLGMTYAATVLLDDFSLRVKTASGVRKVALTA